MNELFIVIYNILILMSILHQYIIHYCIHYIIYKFNILYKLRYLFLAIHTHTHINIEWKCKRRFRMAGEICCTRVVRSTSQAFPDPSTIHGSYIINFQSWNFNDVPPSAEFPVFIVFEFSSLRRINVCQTSWPGSVRQTSGISGSS